jgi:hypothetical protein
MMEKKIINLDREAVRKIMIEDLGMREVSTKIVPQILSDDHKQQWYDVCSISPISWPKKMFWTELS